MHTLFLQRTLELARRSGVLVIPNPRVGAILVHEGKIIGEGWHKKAGERHAEVIALSDVKNPTLLKNSTLYVSLEPCNHFGKTPPCTDLILSHDIPRVVIGCKDPNPKVAGKGIDRLRQAGVEVILADDPKPFEELNKVFFTNQLEKRPYVALKWAESLDGFIAGNESDTISASISNSFSNRAVHRLRGEFQAILVGFRTALIDNPYLNTRLFHGIDPVRIVIDPDLNLPLTLNLFNHNSRVIVINGKKDSSDPEVESIQENVTWFRPKEIQRPWKLSFVLAELYLREGICSVLVEGGAEVHTHLLREGCFDEIYHIAGNKILDSGLPAPDLKLATGLGKFKHSAISGFQVNQCEQAFFPDSWSVYRRKSAQ